MLQSNNLNTENFAINIDNSISYPLLAIPVLVGIYEYISSITLNDLIEYIYSGDLRRIAALSEYIVDTTNYVNHIARSTLDMRDILNYQTDLAGSITRYNNMIRLHNEIENIFEVVQNAISTLEEFNTTVRDINNYFNILGAYYEILNEQGEDLRLAGNLFVDAIRSLEEKIRNENPNFAFLNQL